MRLKKRQKRHLKALLKVEFASLEELSELVDASVGIAVRRDLGVLEGKGHPCNARTAAPSLNPKSDGFAFTARDTHQLDEKEAMAGVPRG